MTHIIIDSVVPCVSTSLTLEEKNMKLFWDPCAAYCINYLFRYIGNLQAHKEAIEKARRIAIFCIPSLLGVYSHEIIPKEKN